MTTGAANARALAERLEESLASARRNSFPVSVCLFDIDDFKAVNDLQGHAAGDGLLKDVVRAAERALRPGDTVARWGGDEFVQAKRAGKNRIVAGVESTRRPPEF